MSLRISVAQVKPSGFKKAYETLYENLLSDDTSRAAEIWKQDAPGFMWLSINILSYTK
jgi:hypothetical protein